MHALIVECGSHRCALPIESVVETMRPLPIEQVPHVPDFVRGLAIVRGRAMPVVDLARVLGDSDGRVGRFVTVRAGGPGVALAVRGVVGTQVLELAQIEQLPPLAGRASPELIRGLAVLDQQFLLLLEVARILPPELAADLEARGSSA